MGLAKVLSEPHKNEKGASLSLRPLNGDPGGIQTHDLQNRNLTFYSAELRGQLRRKGRAFSRKGKQQGKLFFH